MAGKRSATSELNHDNWDKEEESEEAGHFVTASKEELQTRVIRKAKRRGGASTGDVSVDRFDRSRGRDLINILFY